MSPERSNERRRLPRTVHPFLFAVWPVLALYAHNAAELHLPVLVRPLVAVVCGTAALWLVFGLVSRHREKGAVMTSVVTLAFFGLWPLLGWKLLDEIVKPLLGVQLKYLFAAYVLGVLVILALVFRTRRDLGLVTRVLNLCGAVLVVIPLVQAAFAVDFAALARGRQEAPRPRETVSEEPGAGQARPDVYFIVMDGYAREDTLRELYGFDNSAFLEEMRARGFHAVSRSRSNYPYTILSLTACLNMRHIPELFPEQESDTPGAHELEKRFHDNEVHRILRDMGYRICEFPTGFYLTEPTRDTKVVLGGESGGFSELNLFEYMLLDSTPILRIAGKKDAKTYEKWRERILYTLDSVPRVRERHPGQPVFVQAHVVAPHPPFVLDAEGKPRPLSGAFELHDGGDVMEGGEEEYRRLYVEQMKGVNGLLTGMVDRILQDASRESVILIVSDHGPASKMEEWPDRPPNAMRERFSNLILVRLPKGVEATIPDDLALVNLFPTVLRACFGLEYELNPNQCYFAPGYDRPYGLDRIDEAKLTAAFETEEE